MYSFTKPKIKPFFAEDTKLWLIFISAVSALIVVFTLFIAIQGYMKLKELKTLKKEIYENKLQITKLEYKINFIRKEKSIYTSIVVNNELLKNSIKNILSLVPDPITLTDMKMEKNSLILYGITPTKEVYKLLLLPPLKSIFNENITHFYQMNNGWYRFESINKMKESL